MLLVLAFFGLKVSSGILWAPLAIIMLLAFGTAVGMLLVPVGMLFPDVQRAMGLVTSAWFLATPIVYTAPLTGMAALVTRFNPVTPLLTTCRELFTTGQTTQLGPFIVVSLLTLFVFITAWLLLRLAAPHVVARMPT